MSVASLGSPADLWKPATWEPIPKASPRAGLPALLWGAGQGAEFEARDLVTIAPVERVTVNHV